MSVALFVVGAVLTYAGLIKAVDIPQARKLLLNQLRLPCQLGAAAAATLAGMESALGVALMLGVFPKFVIPMTVVLLLCGSALSVRAARQGVTETCGCYGNTLIPVWTSVGLNVGYLALLTFAWVRLPVSGSTSAWAASGVLVLGLAVGIVGHSRSTRPIIDTAHLKVGKRWSRRWSPDAPLDFRHGTYWLAFVQPHCSHCKPWVPFLNIEHAHGDVDGVVGIIPGTSEDVRAFVSTHGASFPVVRITPGMFDAIVDYTPTAVRLSGGVITEVWSGRLPDAVLARVRSYYASMFGNTNGVESTDGPAAFAAERPL